MMGPLDPMVFPGLNELASGTLVNTDVKDLVRWHSVN